MKLLFDQNLSHRLPRLLSDLYVDSVHYNGSFSKKIAADIVRQIGERKLLPTK